MITNSNQYMQLPGHNSLDQRSQKLKTQLEQVQNLTGESRDEQLKKACKNFEVVFVQRMFNEMLKTTSFKEQFGKGSGGEFFGEMFIQKISEDIADKSSIGLADQMYDQMTYKEPDARMSLERLKSLDANSHYERKMKEIVNLDAAEKANTPPLSLIHDNFSDNADYINKVSEFKPEIKQTLFSPGLDKIIETEAEIQGVDSALVKAVVLHESNGNPDAVSPVGAKGLMQLMDGTAKDMGVENSFDIVENLRGGIKYLKKQLKAFNEDLDLALAAYNAGPGNVKKYDGVPPFKETENYIKKITESYSRLKKEE